MNQDYFFNLCRIVEGAINLDPEKVAAYTEQFAIRLEEGGESDLARRMRQLLSKSGGRRMALAKASISPPPRLPVDSESRLAVADEESHQRDSVALVLPDESGITVAKFLEYFRSADKLIANGVGISPTMLIYGDPGTGKTQLARYIASQLEMPLVVSRADGLISSYLGSTAKNVRNLFEHAASRPCVLFLDEFDAIAKMRDDQRELGELKRVVIGLLQNIDAIGRDHVLLAATNHQHLLDPAIWRRFTYKVQLGLPGFEERTRLFSLFYCKFCTAELMKVSAIMSAGLSGAQIRDICENCIRDAVLAGRPVVFAVDALRAIGVAKEGKELASFTADDAILALGKCDQKAFTQTQVAEMFGTDQSRVSRLFKSLKKGR